MIPTDLKHYRPSDESPVVVFMDRLTVAMGLIGAAFLGYALWIVVAAVMGLE